MNNKSINKLYPPAPLGSPAIEDRVRKSQSFLLFYLRPPWPNAPEAKDSDSFKADPICYYTIRPPA